MTTETIRPVITNRFPEFVRTEYRNFNQFLVDFYSWLEKEPNFLYLLNNFQKNKEITNNLDPYVTEVVRSLGFIFNRSFTVPKSTVIHVLRDFYLARGSKQSFELLFRILFNETIDITYPREKVFALSNSEYGKQFFLFIEITTANEDTIQGFVENVSEFSGTLRGIESQTITAIENLEIILGRGKQYLQIEIFEPLFPFIPEELVEITIEETTLFSNLKNVVQFEIANPGKNYRINDIIHIENTNIPGVSFIDSVTSGAITEIDILEPGCNFFGAEKIRLINNQQGKGFLGEIGEVDGSGSMLSVIVLSGGYGFNQEAELKIIESDEEVVSPVSCDPPILLGKGDNIGGIKAIKTISPYIDYDINTATVSIKTETGYGAVLNIIKSPLFTKEQFKRISGAPGNSSTITDSDIYQQFSYELTSRLSPSQYIEYLNTFLHPSGYRKVLNFEYINSTQWTDSKNLNNFSYAISSYEIEITGNMEASILTLETPAFSQIHNFSKEDVIFENTQIANCNFIQIYELSDSSGITFQNVQINNTNFSQNHNNTINNQMLNSINFESPSLTEVIV